MGLNLFKDFFSKVFVFQFLALGLIGSCSQGIEGEKSSQKPEISSPDSELILSAAASMQDVLAEIKQLYLLQYPQAKLTFNFGSSGSLKHQIERGAPVDIFISAAPEQMNELAARELLLNNTRQNLVKNQMVLVTPENNNSLANFDDLIDGAIERVAMGEPNSVPAGKYAREILTNLDSIENVNSKVVYGKDVRQVLNYVATGNIEAGIVYRTDSLTTTKVKVVAIASEEFHSPVIYPIAIVKDSKNIVAAQQLLNFLLSPQAQAVFQKYGFIPLENDL